MTIDSDFSAGIRDYRMLLDLGYPESASIKLVGDRYRLDKTERMVLLRGVSSEEESHTNRDRLARAISPKSSLGVDGYNVAFTIVNYQKGHPTFISSDGFLRDAGGAHGRIDDEARFESALGAVVDFLRGLDLASVDVFLDAPVPMSGRHAEVVRQALGTAGLPGEVGAVKSADFALLRWPGEVLATSDSAIIRRAGKKVFDLARAVLEKRYGAAFPTLLGEGQEPR